MVLADARPIAGALGVWRSAASDSEEGIQGSGEASASGSGVLGGRSAGGGVSRESLASGRYASSSVLDLDSAPTRLSCTGAGASEVGGDGDGVSNAVSGDPNPALPALESGSVGVVDHGDADWDGPGVAGSNQPRGCAGRSSGTGGAYPDGEGGLKGDEPESEPWSVCGVESACGPGA